MHVCSLLHIIICIVHVLSIFIRMHTVFYIKLYSIKGGKISTIMTMKVIGSTICMKSHMPVVELLLAAAVLSLSPYEWPL